MCLDFDRMGDTLPTRVRDTGCGSGATLSAMVVAYKFVAGYRSSFYVPLVPLYARKMGEKPTASTPARQ